MRLEIVVWHLGGLSMRLDVALEGCEDEVAAFDISVFVSVLAELWSR